MAGEPLSASFLPPQGDLTTLPISVLRDAFREGLLCPSQLVSAQIARIRAFNPQVNALVRLELEASMQAAHQADALYLAGEARPLEGITIAIKEAHAFSGRVSTAGSLTHDGRPDGESAPSVRRLIEAGAIPLGRSTVPEFCMSASTHSLRYGTTLNPWNPRYSPGGSSGGAAAAVASGFVTLADGSDHGGSIRTPAACCGLYGYKAPWGRIPLPHDQTGDVCQHYGLLCRHLSDLVLAQDLIAGPDDNDPWSQHAAPCLSELVLPDRPPKVVVVTDFGSFAVSREVRKLLEDVAYCLTEQGVPVERSELLLPADALVAYEGYCLRLARLRIGPRVAQSSVPITDYVRMYLARAETAGEELDACVRFQAVRDELLKSVSNLLCKSDVLLLPTTCSIGVDPQFSIAQLHSRTGGSSMHWEEEWQMTWPFNMASSLPVLAMPAGVDATTGLPFGVQLVGDAGGELSLMRNALFLRRFLHSHWDLPF